MASQSNVRRIQEEAPAQRPAAARPWVLLSALPRIRDDPMVKELVFDLAPAPAVSSLAIRRDAFGIPDNPGFLGRHRHSPYIAAVEPCGRAMLLCVNNFPELEDGADARFYPRRYLLCDAATGSTSGLVELVGYGHPGSVGLVRRPSSTNTRSVLTVAFLTPMDNLATLHYRALTHDSDWTFDKLPIPDQGSENGKRWRNDGCLSLDGRLWWVDLSARLLTCDIFAHTKKLREVPLPPECTEDTTGDIDKTRCVRISGGKVTCVLIHQPKGLPSVTMWSLNANDQWDRGYSISFLTLWADGSYFFRPGMAQKVPDVVAIDPYNPAIVYFLQEHNLRLFAINVVDKKLLECVDTMTNISSSSFVHVWELPPELHRQFHGSDGCFWLLRRLLSMCEPAEESDPPF